MAVNFSILMIFKLINLLLIMVFIIRTLELDDEWKEPYY